MATHETLGLILVRRGVITRPELYDALRLQRSTGQLLGTCLIELGYLEDERLLEFLAEQLGNSHYYSVAKAERDFGYQPQIGFAEAMRRLGAELSHTTHQPA